MDTFTELLSARTEIEKKIKYSFENPKLLALCFVHCSFLNEHPEIDEDNERLEFLGDSVLNLMIAEHLYTTLPHMPEGDLSTLRAKIVESSSCYQFAKKLQLERFLLLGKGEKQNIGKGRESVLANLFEALIGAIFLDGGLQAAQEFLFGQCLADIREMIRNPECNWKAKLQNVCQRQHSTPPTYEVIDEEGPEHQKRFSVAVKLNGVPIGSGEGTSKKQAQQAAAKNAYTQLMGEK